MRGRCWWQVLVTACGEVRQAAGMKGLGSPEAIWEQQAAQADTGSVLTLGPLRFRRSTSQDRRWKPRGGL